jgi:endonuclease/exonuclease/phosphatase (EEP) superfamily protein YafD
MFFAMTPMPSLAHAVAVPQWVATTLFNLAYPVAATLAFAVLLGVYAHYRGWHRLFTVAVVCAAPLFTLALFYTAGHLVPTEIPPRATTTTLRIAHLNSLFWSGAPASKAAFALTSGADVVSLVEASSQLHSTLQIVGLKQYPYQVYTSTPSHMLHLNMLLLSRWPVTQVREWNPRLHLYKIERPGAPFYVLQMHPLSPSSPQDLITRNQQLATINPAELPSPLIAVGDFNSALWDPILKPLLTVVHGPALQAPTFPANLPVVPIDHILTSNSIAQPTLHRIRVANTDHLGLIADFTTF